MRGKPKGVVLHEVGEKKKYNLDKKKPFRQIVRGRQEAEAQEEKFFWCVQRLVCLKVRGERKGQKWSE